MIKYAGYYNNISSKEVIKGYKLYYVENKHSIEGEFKSEDAVYSIYFCLNCNHRDKFFQWKFKCLNPYRVRYMYTDGKDVIFDDKDFDYSVITSQLSEIYNSNPSTYKFLDSTIRITRVFVNSYFHTK